MTDSSLKTSFLNNFALKLTSDISYSFALDEKSNPDQTLAILVEWATKNLVDYLAQLPNAQQIPKDILVVTPSLRLLLAFQLDLFSNSPTEVIRKLISFYVDLIFGAVRKIINRVVEIHKLLQEDLKVA